MQIETHADSRVRIANRMHDILATFPRALIAHLRYWNEDVRNCVETLSGAHPREWAGNHLRIIHGDDIDEIMADELESDPYTLGCFNASFLDEVTGVPAEIIKAAQDGEQYEAIGKWLIQENYVRLDTGPAHRGGLALMYADADGYGHHFAHYDGEQEMFGEWYVFRIN
jgi:hypothetical protein